MSYMKDVDDVFALCKKYFLQLVTNKTVLKGIFNHPFLQPLTIELQEKLLNETVKHPLCTKYKPPLSYKKFFLRIFIDVVEDNEYEPSEELLQSYVNIIKKSNDCDEPCFCSYVIDSMETISLEENKNYVTNGTTGLKTWEASKYLSEWCIENSPIFNNKKVLELGSGCGLLGISILKKCSPSVYIFTDESELVLQQLQRNLAINEMTYSTSLCSDQKKESIVGAELKYKIKVHKLDWTNFSTDDTQNHEPDIILGADIVFNPECVPDLVHTLQLLLENGTSCAYIASEVRNEDTYTTFTSELSKRKLFYEDLGTAKTTLYYHDKICKQKICKISLN